MKLIFVTKTIQVISLHVIFCNFSFTEIFVKILVKDLWYLGDIEDDANKEKTPFLPSEAMSTTPKYLELLYEPDTPPPNDGYEIPNQMLKNESTTKRSSSMVSISECNENVLEKKNQNGLIKKNSSEQ